MTFIRAIKGVFFGWALGLSLITAAQIAVPPLTARVLDQTGTLTTHQKLALEKTLKTFEVRKGSQLAILIVPTTAPETIEQYALRVGEQWKLGRKKIDDGALLVIAKTDQTVRIEVGYGLEGALNDATSKRIISEFMIPRFKEGDFNEGIALSIEQIVRVIDGETLPPPPSHSKKESSDITQYFLLLLMMAFVVGGALRSMFGRFRGAVVTGVIVSLGGWLFANTVFIALGAGLLAMIFTFLSSRKGTIARGMRGHYEDPGRGGGFSGGGGGFGGGGASGRW